MTAVARYVLAGYGRSRRFVAPAVVFAAVVLSLSGHPVRSMAGPVAAGLMAVQAWMALTFFNTQGAADRHVVAAAIGARRFIAARLSAGLALAVLTAVVAWVVELLAAVEGDAVSVADLVLCLIGYLSAAFAGTALAAAFARPLVRGRAVAVLGVASVLLISVGLPTLVAPCASLRRLLDRGPDAHLADLAPDRPRPRTQKGPLARAFRPRWS